MHYTENNGENYSCCYSNIFAFNRYNIRIKIHERYYSAY